MTTYFEVPAYQSADANYRFFTTSLLTGVVKEELPLSSVNMSQALNAAGSFSAELGLYDSKATKENINVNDTAIYVERNGVLIWGGIVLTIQADLEKESLQIGAEGFWSYFKRRYVIEARLYHNTGSPTGHWDQMDIVKDLVLYAQGQGSTAVAPAPLTIPLPPDTPTLPVFRGTSGDPRGYIGVTLEKPMFSEASGVFPADYATSESDDESSFPPDKLINIGDHIEQMSKEDSVSPSSVRGFDFGIFPEYEPISGAIKNVFKIAYPTMGVDTGLILQLGSLMWSLNYSVDGKDQGNQVIGVGKGEGDLIPTSPPVPIYPSDTDPSLFPYPLLQRIASFKDVQNLNTLDSLTQSAYAAVQQPVESLKVTVRPSDEFPLLVPHSGDFLLGDFITVRVDEGWLALDDRYRIVEWGLELGDQGEMFTFTLSKSYSVQFS